MKVVKPKKCVFCGNEFKPRYKTTERACSTRCAIGYAQEKEEKKLKNEWRKEKKSRKESIMSHADWLNLLQKVFNTFIRARDKDMPCISCGTFNGQMHCGHYRSVSVASQLRFNELNCNVQCARCNTYYSGNLIEYRKGLVLKIGIEKVEELENNTEELKLSIPEIKELIEHYRKETKRLI